MKFQRGCYGKIRSSIKLGDDWIPRCVDEKMEAVFAGKQSSGGQMKLPMLQLQDCLVCATLLTPPFSDSEVALAMIIAPFL